MIKQFGWQFVSMLLAVTVASVAVSVWALFIREPKTVLIPDYAPQEEEQYADPIPGTEEQAPWKENSGSVSLNYSDRVVVDTNELLAHLYFANPGKSNHDIVLQIVIQGEMIAQSGLIKSGHKISQIALSDGVEDLLLPGGYDGNFMIYYYDPISNERSMVNTEIPVYITVPEK